MMKKLLFIPVIAIAFAVIGCEKTTVTPAAEKETTVVLPGTEKTVEKTVENNNTVVKPAESTEKTTETNTVTSPAGQSTTETKTETTNP